MGGCTDLTRIKTKVPQCNGKLDVVYVLDVSASMSDPAVYSMHTLVINMVDLFKQSIQDEFRMGVIWYATQIYDGSIIHLTDTNTVETLNNSLVSFNRMTQMNFEANTPKALSRMIAMFTDEGRDNATLAAVLITDSTFPEGHPIASALQNSGIHVFPIGVGNVVIQTELESIATGTIQPVLHENGATVHELATELAEDVCAVTQTGSVTPVIKHDVPVDLYFLLEESDQVLSQDYNLMKDFIKKILERFEINALSAKVGVISNYAERIPIGVYATESEVFGAIDDLNYDANNNVRDLSSSLSILTQSIDQNAVIDRPVVVMAISTGESANSGGAIQEANVLKERQNSNINIISVGVADSSTSAWEMERSSVASDASSNFLAPSFTSLVSETGNSATFTSITNKIVHFASTEGPELPGFDIVVAVDGSQQVGSTFDFPMLKMVITNLINSFEWESGARRFGLLQFDGSGVYSTIHLGHYNNKEDLIDQINDVNKGLVLLDRTASADNSKAIEGIRNEFAAHSRQEPVAKLGYVITMSDSLYPLLVQAHARAALEEGIQLLFLGVNNKDRNNLMELNDLFAVASGPPAVRFPPSFQLASNEMMATTVEDVQFYSSFIRPEQLPIPWNAEFDIIFLVHDEAGRVDMGSDTKEFLKNLVLRFNIGLNEVQVGIVTFGSGLNTGGNKMIELGSRDSIGPLVLAIQMLSLTPTGGPDVLSAIDEGIAMFDRSGRPNVVRLAVLIAEGTPVGITLDDFNKASDAGISMLTVGLGSETDSLMMERFAFNPQLSYMQDNWNVLSTTERMIADINSLAAGVFESNLATRPLSLSTQCAYPASIAILIDTSSSILPILEAVKDFIGILLSVFDLSEVKIGLVGYGSQVHSNTLIELGEFDNYARLYIHFIQTMQPDSNDLGTGTGNAIQFMRTEMFADIPFEKKIGIVVTDGLSENSDETMQEAMDARNAGIKMMTFGVGADENNVFFSELLDITGNDRTAIFSFGSSDFGNNEALKPKLESVAEYICQAAKPPVNCAGGTYYDSSTNSCPDCPRGTYRPEGLENQDSCIDCVQGLTTLQTGSTDLSQCKDLCDSGWTWKVLECRPCGFGKYRAKALHNVCQNCTSKLTTISETSESIADCVPFCPNNDYVGCPDNPCDTTLCVNYPTATCLPNPCGTCSAVFTDKGIDVTPLCLDVLCANDEWPCVSGECILQSEYCDGTDHCIDGSDEARCLTPQLPCDKMDFFMVVDVTQSIDQADFQNMKDMLKNLVNSLSIGPDGVRVSVIPSGGFSNQGFPVVSPVTSFNDANMTREAITAAIDALFMVAGFPRNMGVPMAAAISAVGNELRDGVPHIMLVAPYGESQDQFQVKLVSAFTLYSEIDVVALGVGSEYSETELVLLAKDSNNVYSDSNFTGQTAVCNAAQSYELPVTLTGSCSKPVDMVILMDVSTSLADANLTMMKAALHNLISDLDIGLDKVRVAVISFDNDVNMGLSSTLNASVDREAVKAAIDDQIIGQVQGTALGAALGAGLQVLQNGRPGVSKVMLTISDGSSKNPALTLANAQRIHDSYIYSVVIGLGTDHSEMRAIATDPESVLQYNSALHWMGQPASEVLDKICPQEFTCPSAMDIGFIWDLGSRDVMASALAAANDFSESFSPSNLEVKTVFTKDHASLADAITFAQTELTGTQHNDVVKLIVLMTDQNVVDTQALRSATDSAKANGILVGVLNAKSDTNVDWTAYASSSDVFFEMSRFDNLQYVRFMYSSFCRDVCASGTQVDTSLTQDCSPCPRGSYRDSSESYQCVSCPGDTYTPSVGATSSSQCVEISPIVPCTETLDLILVVDTTDTIDESSFLQVKDFLTTFISSLTISTTNARVGLVRLKVELGVIVPDVVLSLNDPDMSLVMVTDAINSLTMSSHPRDLFKSLLLASTLLDISGRAGVSRLMVFVTYGASTDEYQMQLAAAHVAFLHIDTIVVGVGTDYDSAELNFIASDLNNVVTESSFAGLTSVDISGTVCDAAVNYEGPAEPLAGECKEPLEIVILMDVSQSMVEDPAQESFLGIAIMNIISSLDIGADKIRVGVISFDDDVNMALSSPLSGSVNYAAVSDAVDRQNGGQPGNALGAALLEGLLFLQDSRPGVPRILLTITDGQLINTQEVLANAQAVHDNFIYSLVVVLGQSLYMTEIEALATDIDAVLTYDSPRDWALGPDIPLDVISRVCPEAETCSESVDIVMVQHLDTKDGRVSALNLDKDLKESFTSLTSNFIFDSFETNTLGDAVEMARILINSARSYVVKYILILTDHDVTGSLGEDIERAKNDGIVVGVLDINPSPNIDWTVYASYPELVFSMDRFDNEQYTRFLYDNLCRAACPFGEVVDATQSDGCIPCPKGTYRNGSESYRCEDCPPGQSTPSVGSSYITECNACQPGTYFKLLASCDPCPLGTVQPESAQLGCIECRAGTVPNAERTECQETTCTEDMEIVVVVDTSASIGTGNFNQVKEFLLNLITKFDMSSGAVRVGISPISEETLSADATPLTAVSADVTTAITGLTAGASTRNTASAINMATSLLQAARPDVARLMFILTNGDSDDQQDTQLAAANAMNAGIEIMALSLESTLAELQDLVTQPDFFFTETDYSSLSTLELWEDICQVGTDFEAPPQLQGSCPSILDMVILMDVSESIGELNLTQIKIGLSLIVEMIQDIGPDFSRIGVLSYSGNVNEAQVHLLEDTVNEDTVKAAIEVQPLGEVGEGSYMGTGLMRSLDLFDSARDDVRRILVTFTDGLLSDPNDVLAQAEELQGNFIYSILVGIAVGTPVDNIFSAVATEPEAVILYDSATDFMGDVAPVLEAICPDQYMCETQLEVVTIRAIDDIGVLASALNLQDQMRNSFPNLNDDFVINPQESEPLAQAVTLAVTHFTQQQLLDGFLADFDTSIKKRQAGLDPLLPDSTRLILLISDKPISDEGDLLLAIQAARDNGILVAVINARTELDVDWTGYVSNDNLLFKAEQFDKEEFTWFIQKGCCFAECASGSERSPTGSCTLCPVGSYRDSQLTYSCVSCPDSQTTPSEGASSEAECTICPAGTESEGAGECVECTPGTYKPEGLQECINCPSGLTSAPGSTSAADCTSECDTGQWWNGTTCLQCLDGFIQPDPFSSEPCQECPPDRPLSTFDHTQCRYECGPGEVWNKDFEDCEECLIGFYKPLDLAEECVACPEGYTTDGNGADGLASCIPTMGFKFGQPMYTVLEKDGVVLVEIILDEKQSPAGIGPAPIGPDGISVEFKTVNGTAIAGKDFTYQEDECVFNENENSKTISIPIFDNSFFNNDMIFTIILKPLETGVIGVGLEEPSTATVIIINDDNPDLKFKFSKSRYVVKENAGKVDVEVEVETNFPDNILPTIPEIPVHVVIETSDGTAVAGRDYEAISMKCIFDKTTDRFKKIISVRIIDNDKFGPDTQFQVSLKDPVDGANLVSPSVATVIIENEEKEAVLDGSCEPCVDVVIAVDMSDTFVGNELQCLRDFFTELVNRLELGKSDAHVGIIKFASTPAHIVHLKHGYSEQRVDYQINKHLDMDRVSEIERANACAALGCMHLMFKKERRRNVPLRGLLIMDQKSDNTTAAAEKADLLKSKDVELTVIGTDQTEVDTLASASSGLVITDYCHMPSIDDVLSVLCQD